MRLRSISVAATGSRPVPETRENREKLKKLIKLASEFWLGKYTGRCMLQLMQNVERSICHIRLNQLEAMMGNEKDMRK